MPYESINSRVVVFGSEQQLEDALNGATLPASWGVNSKGGKFTFAQEDGGGVIISAEAQSVLDRMAGLTQTEIDAIIKFVNAESASLGNGNWAFVDEFFSFGLAGANALVGFIAKTAVNNGAVLSIEGAAFAGAEHIDTDYNPTTDINNYTLISAFLGMFVTNKNTLTGRAYFGASTPSLTAMFDNIGTNLIADMNGRQLRPANIDIDSDALYVNTGDSANVGAFKNGAVISSVPLGGISIPTVNFFVGATNSAGSPVTFINGTLSSFIIGGSIGFDQATHYTNLLNYLIDLGTFAAPVLARYSALTQTETDAITAFVNSEVRAGNWGLYDEFFCFSLNATDRLIGMKAKTATNNGATFDINGATLNGIDQWIGSNFVPSVDGVNYKAEEGIAGVFVFANTIKGDNRTALFDTAGVEFTRIWRIDNIAQTRVHVNDSSPTTLGDIPIEANNLYVAYRASAEEVALYLNGIDVGSKAAVGAVLPVSQIEIGRLSTAINYMDGTISTFIVGGAIGFNQVAHNTNQRKLLTDLGVVLP